MREKTILVERSGTVSAAPEVAWSLLSSASAWSLFPGVSFAFDVAASPAGTGHLLFCISAAADGIGGDVLEVCDEGPGHTICVQTRSRQPAGTRVFTLSAEQGRRGLKVSVAVRTPYRLNDALEGEMAWRKRLGSWLETLRAVIDNRAQWPSARLPDAAQRAYAEVPALKDPFSIEEAVTIGASPSEVWRALRSPEAARMAMQAAYSGHVPGTPEGAAGEMRYSVVSQPGGLLPGAVSVVRELDDKRSFTLRRVGRPQDELHVLLRPEHGGTRLVLTSRWPEPEQKAQRERIASAVAKELQMRARQYKAMVE